MTRKLARRVLTAIRDRMEGRVKLTHILLETGIILQSGLVFFPLSKNTQHFDKSCLLNSDIYIFRHNNDSVSLDPLRTVFGDMDDCNFTTFFSIVTFLHGLIWIWFFFHLEALTSKDGSHASLLMPALITHFILFVCTIVCSVMIGEGFSSWCDRIESNNNNEIHSISCKEYQSLSWTVERSSFYTYNLMALISSWLIVVLILASMVMTCVHLYWDFLETAYTKPKKQPVETSGYKDNGVGIVNKFALTYSTDAFYTDTESDSGDVRGAVGGAGASRGSGKGGGAGAHPNTNKTASSEDIVVSATVHTPEDSPSTASAPDVTLRSRGNAASNQ